MTTLEMIRAELHETAEMHDDGDYYLRDKWVDEIIDKYKEQEPKSVCDLCRFDYIDDVCGDCPAMTKTEWEK